MKLFRWETVEKLRELLEETAPSPEQMALRLQSVERDIILPVKGVFIAILCYSFYVSRWFEDVALPRSVAQQIIERFFLIYLLVSVVVAFILFFSRRLSPLLTQRVIFTASFLDGLFVCAVGG